jgi:hypothetical protein
LNGVEGIFARSVKLATNTATLVQGVHGFTFGLPGGFTLFSIVYRPVLYERPDTGFIFGMIDFACKQIDLPATFADVGLKQTGKAGSTGRLCPSI